MSTDVFAGAVEDIKPVIAKGSSDSAALDSYSNCYCRQDGTCLW